MSQTAHPGRIVEYQTAALQIIYVYYWLIFEETEQ